MYLYDENFLYELIETYKDAETLREKDNIFRSFSRTLWSSPNKRRIYTKSVKFHVRRELLSTPLGQVFNTWSDVEYRHYKSTTKDDTWSSILRQKVNNLYTWYFDKNVIMNDEYMDLLKTPKRLYLQWISGASMDPDEVTELIDTALSRAEQVKLRARLEKMTLLWNAYKKLVEGILRQCFDHCRLLEEYEDGGMLPTCLDCLTEDHFYTGYMCRYLDREMLSFQKKYYGVRSHKKYLRCRQCGDLIEKTGNKKMYCSRCAAFRKKESNKKADKRYKGVRDPPPLVSSLHKECS